MFSFARICDGRCNPHFLLSTIQFTFTVYSYWETAIKVLKKGIGKLTKSMIDVTCFVHILPYLFEILERIRCKI